MDPPFKLRKLSVKLRALSFVNTTPEAIQELIVNRIRECRVNLHRTYPNSAQVIQSGEGQALRRCCVRLPRMPSYVARSEISTPTTSIAPSESCENLEQV